MSIDYYEESENFYNREEEKFDNLESEWQEFKSEFPTEFKRRLLSGITHSLSSGTSSNQIHASLSFSRNSDDAKEYLMSAQRKMLNVAGKCESSIREIDRKLEKYDGNDIYSFVRSGLISLLEKEISFLEDMELDVAQGRNLQVELPDEIKDLKYKW